MKIEYKLTVNPYIYMLYQDVIRRFQATLSIAQLRHVVVLGNKLSNEAIITSTATRNGRTIVTDRIIDLKRYKRGGSFTPLSLKLSLKQEAEAKFEALEKRKEVKITPLVYLGGTITENSIHIDWRFKLAKNLLKKGFYAFNPIEGLDPSKFKKDGLSSGDLIKDQSIVSKDIKALEKSDIVLLYYPDTILRQSIGTWAELGYAYALDKFIITCSPIESITSHPFIKEMSSSVITYISEVEPILDSYPLNDTISP